MHTSKSVVALDSRRELLVDDWLVETRQNVALHLTEPRREEVVWTNEPPLDGPTSCYFNVLQTGSLIRLYYRGANDQFTCYAQSEDGLHFERPQLGLYEFEGSRDNNIVFRGSASDSFASHNFAPFLDANPQAKEGAL